MKKLMVSVVLLHLVYHASAMPKSKTKIHMDQKQSGDYNIRLNLKDFQIIALLGDESIGDIGNLDYNYDYSELTIKPNGHTTSTTIAPSTSTTLKQENSTSSSVKLNETLTTIKSTITVDPNISTTTTTKKTDEEVPGKIPVFVQIPKKIATHNKQAIQSQTVSLNPSTSSDGDEDYNQKLTLSDSMRVRRCPTGLTRDKRGRCRKLRRPQFPFELARIASNLAAKLSPVTREESGEIDLIEE